MTSKKRDSKNEGEELDSRVKALSAWALDNLSFEQAVHMFALHKAVADSLEKLLEQSNSDHQKTLRMLSERNSNSSDVSLMLRDAGDTLSAVPGWLAQAVLAGLQASKIKASKQGRMAADIRHSKPGESRDKKKAIQDAWASGKYSSRDVCAEQECAALNMAPGTARKALRNTPEPPSRCTA